ncbi:MAG: cupin domain-containing protein [Aigarchaeota archaeon]|nr:cupin domain-containing protein [Candidatus Pelearchaeum maunauluense]
MYVVNVGDVEFKELEKGDAVGVRVKYLVGEEHGAKNFYLRLYEVDKGGKTPLDRHIYEHEVYIAKGVATLVYEQDGVRKTRVVKEGDTIYIGSNELHQFINIGDDKLVFLCVRGAEKIYEEKE